MVTRADALSLESASGKDLHWLLREAADVRDRAWGRTVTYSPKVFIPLTNLCRDTCGYCVFARPEDEPGAGFLSPDQVLAIARAGEAAGCKEALFSLGERPELRYPEARAALERLGHETTLSYLRAMCGLVRTETSLLPHANPGRMSEEEIADLAPSCASMGMMLENVSERLMKKGEAHEGCPDKHPRLRLETLEAAGRLGVPFTTGILIGIGETWEERVDSLLAIREIHERHDHIQEVIVQNFRAKPGIRFSDRPEPAIDDMLRTIAVARLLLPQDVSLQSPPNLMADYGQYLDAGVNDFGGISPVTIDHINPERAWPMIPEIESVCAARGFRLEERLTVYA